MPALAAAYASGELGCGRRAAADDIVMIDPVLRDIDPVADGHFAIEHLAKSRDVRDLDHRAVTCGSAS